VATTAGAIQRWSSLRSSFEKGIRASATVDGQWYNGVMSDDQFTKLFKYIESFRNDVHAQFEDAAQDRADIRGAIGEISAQVRDYHNEMTFSSHQLDKLHDAISQIAKETGVKLSVEI